MYVPWPSWPLSGSSIAEGGANMLCIVSAVMGENSVPLISPRYKFTIGISGEALSARMPSPSRHPSQINTQAAQADLPIVGSLLTRGTKTRGLQAGHPQDEPSPQPQREAHGNDGIEPLCVCTCLHITIPHSRQCKECPTSRKPLEPMALLILKGGVYRITLPHSRDTRVALPTRTVRCHR